MAALPVPMRFGLQFDRDNAMFSHVAHAFSTDRRPTLRPILESCSVFIKR
jgi:hypothetical protein